MKALCRTFLVCCVSLSPWVSWAEDQPKLSIAPPGSIWKGKTKLNGKEQSASMEVLERDGKKMILVYELENKSKFQFECEFDDPNPKRFNIKAAELLEAVPGVNKDNLTVGGIKGHGLITGRKATLNFDWKENNLGPYKYQHSGNLIDPKKE